MTGRGSPSRFLTAVLHNGVGRYVRQLQRLQLLFSATAADARGARQFVEEAAQDFARQHPDVVIYVSPRSGPGPAPVLRAEYLNGTVRDELIASKTSEEIVQLATKLANQSGLDVIRIRKPFHTDNPSIQGQWHPLTNKPSILTIQGPRLQPQ
ncbi:large ribosomal subunit protein mL43 [Haemorhous mexicanus]|uniref:large ribosomal subunit protein mL43 n=1 Tax=Haemorhous mexicanus TaxID=30427 RepID=UPI0028BE86F4|nr:large ribosomal subunit protein mL43 [Haemorhous mexicanus]